MFKISVMKSIESMPREAKYRVQRESMLMLYGESSVPRSEGTATEACRCAIMAHVCALEMPVHDSGGVLNECVVQEWNGMGRTRDEMVCRCKEWLGEPEGLKHGTTATAIALVTMNRKVEVMLLRPMPTRKMGYTGTTTMHPRTSPGPLPSLHLQIPPLRPLGTLRAAQLEPAPAFPES